MALNPKFFDCAESALLVDFGLRYDKRLSLSILNISRRLKEAALAGLGESVPALSSLTILYDPLKLSRERLILAIEALCKIEDPTAGPLRVWEIPVAYGGKDGPDLGDLVSQTGLMEDEIIRLHTEQLYHVYMLGFLPGFAYLGDLPDKLQFPRRSTPRAHVPAGSVAIASDMTAIYPLESPGGWHLIGYTPISLWDMAKYEEPLFKPGDQVRFRSVSEAEAQRLRLRVAKGWRPEPEEAR